MDIADLDRDDPRLDEAHAVLIQLRPHLDLTAFREVYAEGHPQGLRFSAGWTEGRCVAVAGWRLIACTQAVRKLYIDDLVTSADVRSSGHGRQLLAHLERVARRAGASILDLDSGVARHDAHRFYLRERMAITSHHFSKPLE